MNRREFLVASAGLAGQLHSLASAAPFVGATKWHKPEIHTPLSLEEYGEDTV